MAGMFDTLLEPNATPFYFNLDNDMDELNKTLGKIEDKHLKTFDKLPNYILVEGDNFVYCDAFGAYIHNLSITICENEYRLIKKALGTEDFDILLVRSEYFRRAAHLSPLFYHHLGDDNKDVPVFDHLRMNIFVKLADKEDIICVSFLFIPTKYTIEMVVDGYHQYCLTYDEESSKVMYEYAKKEYDNLNENIKDKINEFAGIYKEEDDIDEKMFPFGQLSMELCNSLFYRLEIESSVKMLDHVKKHLKDSAIC